MENIAVLVEEAFAVVDLGIGEVSGEGVNEEEEEYDTVEDKYFMEAFNNVMTPL